ncbi:uncharacterized protein LOC143020161 [Oratosquilla oratoria]|uniref:uncharacterized protein LOC143020161 n=1 Tax=Oratosquilla oratoria TaxID=337810 RepID=UPI003F75F2FF
MSSDFYTILGPLFGTGGLVMTMLGSSWGSVLGISSAQGLLQANERSGGLQGRHMVPMLLGSAILVYGLVISILIGNHLRQDDLAPTAYVLDAGAGIVLALSSVFSGLAIRNVGGAGAVGAVGRDSVPGGNSMWLFAVIMAEFIAMVGFVNAYMIVSKAVAFTRK